MACYNVFDLEKVTHIILAVRKGFYSSSPFSLNNVTKYDLCRKKTPPYLEGRMKDYRTIHSHAFRKAIAKKSQFCTTDSDQRSPSRTNLQRILRNTINLPTCTFFSKILQPIISQNTHI